MIIPTDYDWHLLVGDDSALPAIHRRLEELPAGTRAIVRLQIADAAGPARCCKAQRSLDVQWVPDSEALVAAVRSLPLAPAKAMRGARARPPPWPACASAAAREAACPKEALKVAVYWKPGAADFHETLDA